MLIYERKSKKDIKVLVPEAEVEEAKAQGIELNYDEEKKEYSKQVKYRDSANDGVPNEIYKKVFEDNKKYTFENDIYSKEFFNFLQDVLASAAKYDIEDVKTIALQIAQRGGFEILARCKMNAAVAPVAQVMIDILASSDAACRTYMKQLIENNNAEVMMEILLDTSSEFARKQVVRVIKFLLCKLKLLEKTEIES